MLTKISYCVTKYIFLKIYYKIFCFLNAWQFQTMQTVCITASYIQQDIVIVFTMTFKCVLNVLRTHASFTVLQEEK